MKVPQAGMLSEAQLSECRQLGERLARLRVARAMKQSEAALRAGISRNTAYRLEHGDPGAAVGQVVRYLNAIAPGATLLDLLAAEQPELNTLAVREQTQRVRCLPKAELDELNF